MSLNVTPTEYARARLRPSRAPEPSGDYTYTNSQLAEEGYGGMVEHRNVAAKCAAVETSQRRALLLLEALVMAQFDHANILAVIGVITIDGPITVLRERVKTDLRTFLQAEQPTMSTQLAMCADLARAVDYLTTAGYYHRALRARNVYVTEELVVKVAGFDHSTDFLDDLTFVD